MSKIKLVFFTSFLFLFLIFFFFVFFTKSDLSKINCDSRINFMDINNKLNAKIYYTFNLDENGGWLKINGEINKDKIEYKINRKLYFSYQRNKNIFTLLVNKITIWSDNSPDSLLSDILPLAYMHEGAKMDIFIYPQNYGGYLFTSSNFNSTYCQN
ncbi:MAG TPA: hypothetical protein DD649_05920 [Providencia sp.]|uniref:hypothetical protein n=1 Tax=Providencia sp. TaxID=589 RepID=UPI000E8995DD|nr:hypothetical protein [Providencia sp.]MBP6082682.1 hypothetical protein [Providencia sp.]HBO22413.1 hypothetical protein [Providencia sp.]